VGDGEAMESMVVTEAYAGDFAAFRYGPGGSAQIYAQDLRDEPDQSLSQLTREAPRGRVRYREDTNHSSAKIIPG